MPDDPEPERDLLLVPAGQLEVVVERRHPEDPLAAAELEVADLDDDRRVSITKMSPMSGRTRIWPVISAMTASVAPRDKGAGIAHEDLGRVDVEPEEAEQGADDQRAQEGEVRLGRRRSAGRSIRNATKAKTSVPPARPSRPSVMFTPLLAATIAKAANSDVDPRIDGDRARRTGRAIAVDVVGVLDLPRRDDRDDDLPDELLADTDAVARLRVQVVVEGAEQPDAGQGRERREGRRVRAASAGAGRAR